MGNKRFSMTTYVLVGISLVALYFVGKTVTPPPPAPPEAVPANAGPRPPANSQAEQDRHKREEEQSDRARQEKQRRMMSASRKNTPVDSKAFNPNMIDTTTGYWQEQKDGAQGAKEMQAKVAKATAGLKQPTVPTKGVSPVIPGP